MISSPRKLMSLASICISLSIIAPASAVANVTMNAMCFMNQNENSAHPFNPTNEEINSDPILRKKSTNISDQDIQTKFRIASVSKVLTTHWAISSLGPEYRFATKVHLWQGSEKNHCSLHIQGDMDPTMGREMLDRLFTQLRTKLTENQCDFIDNISYDEYFPVFLNFMGYQQDHAMGWKDPGNFLNSTKTQEDFFAFVKSKSHLNANLSNIGLVTKNTFDDLIQNIPHKTFLIKSLPLYVIVKDLNKFSFNYPPNVIFRKLGGKTEYTKFIQDRLGLTNEDVEMYNGSGYPAVISGVKKYNLVSCSSIVTIIKDLDKILSTYKGTGQKKYQLADVLPVGGVGETYSTFKGLYSGGTYENTLVAKTGSAEKAITFAGMLSTQNGDLYFAALTSPDNYEHADLTNARVYIRSLVQALAERFNLKRFDYRPVGNMKAYDDQSALIEENTYAGNENLQTLH